MKATRDVSLSPRSLVIAAVFLVPAVVLYFVCRSASGAEDMVSLETNELIAVAPPPFSEGIFPCSDCHDPEDEVNRTRRKLVDMHENVDSMFDHDAANRWCLDCHDATNRDQLHLADGRPVKFSESYKLCGQCHGPKLLDWEAGDHGKRTGSWSGRKQYLLCVHCHNPHSPRFKPLKPLPPPVRQEELK